MSDILSVKKKSIKVSYNGADYIVAKPSTRQINDFSKNESKTIEATVEFLEKLGLPADVSWEIDVESLQEIVEALVPKLAQKKS